MIKLIFKSYRVSPIRQQTPKVSKNPKAQLQAMHEQGARGHQALLSWLDTAATGTAPQSPQLHALAAAVSQSINQIFASIMLLRDRPNCSASDFRTVARTLQNFGCCMRRINSPAAQVTLPFAGIAAIKLLRCAYELERAARRADAQYLPQVAQRPPLLAPKATGMALDAPRGLKRSFSAEPRPSPPKRARHERLVGLSGSGGQARGPKVLAGGKLEQARPPKTKRPFGLYQGLPAIKACAGVGFSKLYTLSGAFYVMTSTIVSGGSGKVRYGYTQEGFEVAIKEVRHQTKPGVDKNGMAKTYPLLRPDVYAEASVTAYLRQSIDGSMTYWDSLPEKQLGSMKRVRSGVQPFALFDIINDTTPTREKTYLVMQKQAGDLADLLCQIDATCREAVARSFAYQGFMELAVLHDVAGYVHGDLKAQNVLWNGLGQMCLFDFGLARPSNDPAVEPLRGLMGSLRAPEMLTQGEGGRYVPHTPATDVFAMGIVVAELAQASGSLGHEAKIPNPFGHHFYVPDLANASPEEHHRVVFERFEAWKRALLGADGRVDVALIGEAEPSLFTHFFRDLAASNPCLCSWVLNDCMHLDPAARLTASLMAAKASLLCGPYDPPMLRLRQAMAALDPNGYSEALRQAAHAYDVFDTTCCLEDAAQSAIQAGRARLMPG